MINMFIIRESISCEKGTCQNFEPACKTATKASKRTLTTPTMGAAGGRPDGSPSRDMVPPARRPTRTYFFVPLVAAASPGPSRSRTACHCRRRRAPPPPSRHCSFRAERLPLPQRDPARPMAQSRSPILGDTDGSGGSGARPRTIGVTATTHYGWRSSSSSSRSVFCFSMVATMGVDRHKAREVAKNQIL